MFNHFLVVSIHRKDWNQGGKFPVRSRQLILPLLQWVGLQVGHSYRADKQITHSNLSKPEPDSSPYPKIISAQFCRNRVIQIEDDVVVKRGQLTRPNEEAALKLVKAHAPDVPVPTVYHSHFERDTDGKVSMGRLYLDFIPGESLQSAWPRLSMSDKERLCRDTWALIDKLRLIPRPQDGEKLEDGQQPFYCTADGSTHIMHRLLGGGNDYDRSPPFRDDEALRTQIWERYVEHNGLSYRDGQSVRDELPHLDKAVFTHGDIHPGNILVNEKKGDGSSGQVEIVGLVDFESAGFVPDYWDYAQVMRYAPLREDYVEDEGEWSVVMERTARRKWNIRGIQKARRVLF